VKSLEIINKIPLGVFAKSIDVIENVYEGEGLG
jgi:hypothetical protein